MISAHRLVIPLLLAASLSACGDDDGGAIDSGVTIDSAGGGPDAGSGLAELIGADWTVPAGSELYQCTRVTTTRDMYINQFVPTIPLGTHHTVVTLDTAGSVPDGTYECSNPFEGGGLMIYGTGVGSPPRVLPPGIAVKIPAGAQIVLNLHLFNTDDTELSGRSTIDVGEMDVADVVHEARVDLFGKITGLIIPTGVQTQSASCTIASELTVFSTSAHMHQLGTHLTATVVPAGGGAAWTLYDEDYDFDLQGYTDEDPFALLHPGDVLTVDCTYNNTTGAPVTFGESSTDEMCFAGLFLYPYDAPLCNP